ncbi:MAG: sigma-54-dependent Fis family transcriptional regulator [Clostridia bacterium]|nr:sigma-54-dependent Fis family transcriptional regulator [Clostridia bacterium]
MPQLHISRTELYRRGGILDEIMDSVFDNAILTDRDCRILRIGSSAFRSPTQRAALVGQHISVLDAVSPFEEVIRTGQARLDLLLELYGRKCLSSLFPVVDGNEVIGVLGTITMRNLGRLKQVVSQIGEASPEFAGLYQSLARVESGLTLEDYLGDSPLVADLLRKARRAAESDAPILIIGETGTGKEIIASGIHAVRSKGRPSPYVTINCTAIPHNLLESELFGHEKGAFTGAADRKLGKFQLAGDGDILLDEIGDMDLLMQAKLLRVLESREFERVGGHDIIPLRAGVIASTNQNLLRRSEERVFRPDLYYRLSAIELYLSALRTRPDDVPMLIEHFVARKGSALRFTSEAMEMLKRYPWPGNVRQLKNLVDRWLVFYGGALITGRHIADELTIGQRSYNEAFGVTAPLPDVPKTLADREAEALKNALEECGGNVTAAARCLGISRAAFYQKRKRHGG